MRPLLLFQPLLLTRPHPLCCQTWMILRARLTWWQRCVCGQCQSEIESCVACRTVRAWMRSVGPVGAGYEEAELEADRWKDAELPYPAASNGREPSAMMEISRTSSPKILNRRSKWARDRVWTRIVSIWGCPNFFWDVLCHISVICNLCVAISADCSGPVVRGRGSLHRPADIPPIDPSVLVDLHKHTQDVAQSVELMLRSLNGTIQNVSITLDHIQSPKI